LAIRHRCGSRRARPFPDMIPRAYLVASALNSVRRPGRPERLLPRPCIRSCSGADDDRARGRRLLYHITWPVSWRARCLRSKAPVWVVGRRGCRRPRSGHRWRARCPRLDVFARRESTSVAACEVNSRPRSARIGRVAAAYGPMVSPPEKRPAPAESRPARALDAGRARERLQHSRRWPLATTVGCSCPKRGSIVHCAWPSWAIRPPRAPAAALRQPLPDRVDTLRGLRRRASLLAKSFAPAINSPRPMSATKQEGRRHGGRLSRHSRRRRAETTRCPDVVTPARKTMTWSRQGPPRGSSKDVRPDLVIHLAAAGRIAPIREPRSLLL